MKTNKNLILHDHLRYAQDVLGGKIEACSYVKLACQRAIDNHNTEISDDWPYKFFPEFVEPIIKFAEFVPHIKGEWATTQQKFKPQPWQKFLIGELYGWRFADNPYRRRYTECLLEIGRKNGKTSLLAMIAIYELLYGDAGAEVVSAATKQDQAKIVWELSANMLKKMPVEITQNVRKIHNEISFGDSTFKPLSRESKTLDGLNVSTAIIDEAAQVVDRYIIEVLDTSMGSRLSPLTFYITTAGSNSMTYYFERQQLLKSVLAGQAQAEQMFGLIYTLDDDSEIDDETKWIKANPNLDVSLYRDFLRKQVSDSALVPAQRDQILIKHFNLWRTGSEKWLGSSEWNESIVQGAMRSGPCYIGNDLAMSRDLCYTTRLFQHSRRLYFADFKGFLPEVSYESLPQNLKPIYDQGIDKGSLILTPGQITDYEQIESYLRQSAEEYDVRRIGFDPYNAIQIVNRLENDRLPILLVGQSMAKMSAPSKILEQLILERRISHLPEPFITWQLENCHAYVDLNKNLKIRKGPDPNAKIDAIVALAIAVACADVGTEPEEEASFVFLPMYENETESEAA